MCASQVRLARHAGASALSLNRDKGRYSAEDGRSHGICNVIYQKVYLIRLINVSGFLSN